VKLRPSLFLGALVTGAVLGGCGSDAKGPQVEVVSTKTTCTPAQTAFTAGKVTFKVVNKGAEATELYVRDKSGGVVGEVENVGPGTSRTLTADLKAGDYQLSCKPGQTGDGITQPITVRDSGAGPTSTTGS